MADIVATYPPLHLLYVRVYTENSEGTFSPVNSEFNPTV